MDIIFLLRNSVFFILIVAIYFQVPFSELSSLIVPMIAVYFFLSFRSIIFFIKKKYNLMLFIIWIVLLSTNFLMIVIYGGDCEKAIRFFSILLLILLAFGTVNKEDDGVQYKIFTVLTICKVIFLICLAIVMIVYDDYVPFRIWAQTNNYGDMYFVYDCIPRIQIFGNSLLVVALLVEVFKKNQITFVAICIMIGIIIAGNLSFIISMFALLLYFYGKKSIKTNIKHLGTLPLVLCICFLFFSYTNSELEKKAMGNDGNLTRITQIEILMDNDNIFWGNGLGANVPKMHMIGYPEDSLYYEVQSAYIFYQIGLINFLLFVIINIIFIREYRKKDAGIFYCIYILSACANPYFFDATHVLSIHFLVNIFSDDYV